MYACRQTDSPQRTERLFDMGSFRILASQKTSRTSPRSPKRCLLICSWQPECKPPKWTICETGFVNGLFDGIGMRNFLFKTVHRCSLKTRWPGSCRPRFISDAADNTPVDVNVIRVQNMPVLDMLRLEESLFRHDANNWCVINAGTPPCVVAGRSSVIADTVHVENTRAAGIPIIRRFTGGGVVYVLLPPCLNFAPDIYCDLLFAATPISTHCLFLSFPGQSTVSPGANPLIRTQ